jgi:hypothetical protein
METLQKWKTAGFAEPEGKGSLYAMETGILMQKVLQVDTCYTKVVTDGYQPEFYRKRAQYRERNNRSALNNMVKEKVQEWEQEGYVTRTASPSLCINPLVIKISS